MFWIVQGVFVIVFFGLLGALFLSHGVSIFVNFLGEYLNISPGKMMEP